MYVSLVASFLPMAKELSGNIWLFAIPIILGMYLDSRKEWPLTPQFYKYMFTPLVILATLTVFLLSFTIESLAYLLLFMEGVKLLGPKANRDIIQLIFLGLFNILLGAVFTIDLIFLIGVIVYFAGASLALGLINVISTAGDITISRREAQHFLGVLFSVPILSFALAAFFFVIMPRTAYVFFEANLAGRSFASGVPDKVKLGDVSDELTSERPVFRVNVNSRLKETELYWRGITYDYFDGVKWESTLPTIRVQQRIIWFEADQIGSEVSQWILLDPLTTSVIFALDHPFYFEIPFSPAYVSVDGRFVSADADFSKRVFYKAYSIEGPIVEKNIDSSLYLQVPEKLYPTLKTLADSLAKGLTPAKAAARIEGYFRQNFKYSLKTDFGDENRILEFLRKKEGYCEYFATAMALMMRCLGIPARTVGGFKGGDWNEYGHYYIVREKHAHLWVEVYVDSMWMRFDPTPYKPESYRVSTLKKIYKKIQNYLDYLRIRWYGNVVNYTFQRQRDLFISIGMKVLRLRSSLKTTNLKRHIIIAIALIFGLSIGFNILRYMASQPSDPVVRIYLKELKKVERRTKQKKGVGETPLEFALRIGDQKFIDFTLRYYRVRYGGEDIEVLKRRN